MRASARYLLAAGITVAIAIVLLHLPSADLRVPFTYGGDALFYQAMIKSLIDHGWYLHNDSLGMPFGTDMHDFPMPDNLSYAVLKVMGLVLQDSGLVLNLFFLLTLPLTTLAAYWAMTRLPISAGPALCCALLYSFSNYHVNRCVNHLMYTAYFAVPLVSVLALRLSLGSPRPPGTLVGLLICAVTASTGGAYYTCFAVFVLGAAAVLRALESRSWRAALAPLGFAAFTVLVMVANVIPTILYRAEHGAVPVAERPAHDAETFALKPAQLVLPILHHRVPALAELRARYSTGPDFNESFDCTLGFVGALGFVLTMLFVLFGMAWHGQRTPARRLWSHLSSLNAVCLAAGTVGGLGALVALLVSPQIRGYNRISTFLLFFSLCATALVLERLVAWGQASRVRRSIVRLSLVAVTTLGLLDQTPSMPLLGFEYMKSAYREDAEFFAGVEAVAPARGMVFQMPIGAFPESDYDHLKAYVHTRGLRWSFGAMRHRLAQRWQEHVSALPADSLVETLATVGFVGVVVDRGNLPDQGAELGRALEQAGAPLVTSSATRRWSYFDLTARAARLEASVPPAEWERRREAARCPHSFSWGEGFYPPGPTSVEYRWSDKRSVLRVDSITASPRPGRLAMSLASLTPCWVFVRTPWSVDKVALPGNGHAVSYERVLVLPPGPHEIELRWEAGPQASRPTGYPPFCVYRPRVEPPG